MVKFNETLTDTSYFEVDGNPYGKGNYEPMYAVVGSNDVVGIFNLRKYLAQGTVDFLVPLTPYFDWTNNSDVPYASLADLQTDLKAAFFKN